jgi:hypothetical protein
LAGYYVQVFEFIGGEHTSKNVMITAVRNKRPLESIARDDITLRISNLAKMHGIHTQKLANRMDVSLCNTCNAIVSESSEKKSKSSAKGCKNNKKPLAMPGIIMKEPT